MSVRLADVIDVLDQAYPPRLAQSWDSVGLVCGDPDDVVDSVTVAVDATPAVVDQVPQAGLLLVHHPLLLRGVDTVAANTPKGVLVHRLIRTGRSLFTAHTNADSASPGVSDALAHAVGLTVDAVLDPVPGAADLDKWVIYVPRENSEAVRAAVFEAGAGHIGDYSHCSWSVAGTGQFLAHDGGCGIGRDVGLPPAAVAVSEFLLDRHWLVRWWRPRFFPAARPDLGVGEIAQADRCQNAERDPLDAIGQERPGI